jgi:hypothetical protein
MVPNFGVGQISGYSDSTANEGCSNSMGGDETTKEKLLNDLAHAQPGSEFVQQCGTYFRIDHRINNLSPFVNQSGLGKLHLSCKLSNGRR